MRTEGKQAKDSRREAESMLGKTVKYVKTLESAEAKKESEETQEQWNWGMWK